MAQIYAPQVQECPTIQQSVVMMRNLLRAAFSSICFTRNIFPDSCFADRSMAGMELKTLRPETKEAQMLCRWLEDGVFEALEKQYVKTIVFGVYTDPENPSRMTETYKFNVSYPEKDQLSMALSTGGSRYSSVKATKYPTKEEIKSATVTMLRTLLTLSRTLAPLPKDRYLTLKLLYQDDTPDDYEPKFFRPTNPDDVPMFLAVANARTDVVRMNVGKVLTQYHTLDLKVSAAAPIDEMPQNTTTNIAVEEESVSEFEEEASSNLSQHAQQGPPAASYKQPPSDLDGIADEVEATIRADSSMQYFTRKNVVDQFGLEYNKAMLVVHKLVARGILASKPTGNRGRRILTPDSATQEVDKLSSQLRSTLTANDTTATDADTTDDPAEQFPLRVSAPRKTHVDRQFSQLTSSTREQLGRFAMADSGPAAMVLTQNTQTEESGSGHKRAFHKMSEVEKPVHQKKRSSKQRRY